MFLLWIFYSELNPHILLSAEDGTILASIYICSCHGTIQMNNYDTNHFRVLNISWKLA